MSSRPRSPSGDKDMLLDLCNTAGIHDAVVALREGTMTYPTIEVFVETEVKGSPLEALLDAESYQGLMQEAQEKLQQFCAKRRRSDHADGRVHHHSNKVVITVKVHVLLPGHSWPLSCAVPRLAWLWGMETLTSSLGRSG